MVTGVKSEFLCIILRFCYPPGDRFAHSNQIKSKKIRLLCSPKCKKPLEIKRFSLHQTISLIMNIAKYTPSTDFCMSIKNYIDTEYSSISSSGCVCEKFHYSREHISWKFKDVFNISISDYIAKRRVLESLPLLNEMSTSEAAYEVGFKSQSAYIAAFKKNMECLPSEYKKHKYNK